MPPRIDSPTNLESVVMEEDEDHDVDAASLTSRPFRRVPTPMGQSHTTSSVPQGEDSLFDRGERSDKSSPRSNSSSGGAQNFFGADFETLSSLKTRANNAAQRGKVSLQELVYGAGGLSPSSSSGEKGAVRSSSSSSSPSKKNEGKSSSSALSMFDAITKPFVACSAHIPKEFDEAVGNLVANAATVVIQKTPSEDLSRNYSYDEEYDAARQLRRMTSWNTLETNATLDTANTGVSYLTEGTDAPAQTIYDDDGNPIPNILVDLTKEMRQKRTRRKRVVKFHYPPISSLKECPRPDPDDLPNLYFTEDELNQIEDDRISTTVADDVEVVCVSSSESTESQQPPYEARPLRELGEVDESDTTSLLHQHEDDHLQTAQQKQRRYRGRSPAPRSKKLFGIGSSVGRHAATPTSLLPPKHPPTSPAGQHRSHSPIDTTDDGSSQMSFSQSSQSTYTTASSQPPPQSKRLIKSVHIFMRERSRERSAEI